MASDREDLTPEPWALVLIVERKPGENAPPDWALSSMLDAHVEVVDARPIDPAAANLRIEVGNDAVWLHLEDDGQVTW